MTTLSSGRMSTRSPLRPSIEGGLRRKGTPPLIQPVTGHRSQISQTPETGVRYALVRRTILILGDHKGGDASDGHRTMWRLLRRRHRQ